MQTTGVIGHPADTAREPDDESEVTEARMPPGPGGDTAAEEYNMEGMEEDWDGLELGKFNQLHVVAPGEGKTPVSLTYTEDWDAKAFPMLHPDGCNHLTDERRKKRLGELEYFKQRLFHIDPRWRNHPFWVFAAAVYREKKDFERNIDLGYKKGKRKEDGAGNAQYSLDDPYSVFQNVANTPAYHKKGKMEMMARLDNFGPFHAFFTVSCADYRWKENVVAVLRERGIGVRCTIDADQEEDYEVYVDDERGWMPVDDYVANEMDETLHDVLKRNVVTATRNYQQRVQTLMQTVVNHPSNPLSVKHYASKLEFQARGAGHNHGVLWLDIERIERKVDVRRLDPDAEHDPEADHHLIDPEGASLSHLKRLEELVETRAERDLDKDERQEFDRLRLLFPLYGLKNALRRLHKSDEVTDEDLSLIVTFVDTYTTVSLHPAVVGPIVAAIAAKVNQHHHTKTCRKYQTVCRFNMPKLPSYETLVACPPSKDLTDEDKKKLDNKHRTVVKKVREVLVDKEAMAEILLEFPKEDETTLTDAKEGRARRIDAVLDRAGLTGEAGKQSYRDALAHSGAGFTVVMARDIDELMVNSYNPEITRAWNGNTDFQICLDFYAIITYITEYYAKDDTGLVKILVNTLKASDSEDLKNKMRLLMNTWIKNRQMGEAEAVYRLTREFHFRDSDAKCVFMQTAPSAERSKILKNVTNQQEKFLNVPKVTVDNHKDGVYVEQYDIHSKYARLPREDHPVLEHLSMSQMVKMYVSFWGKKSKKKTDDEDGDSDEEEMDANGEVAEAETREVADDEEDSDQKFKRVMAVGWQEGQGPRLPKVFKLTDPYPGEPPFLRLRNKPAVLRFHKYKMEKDPSAYWFSEAILYLPHETEDDLMQRIEAAKAGGQESWQEFVDAISHVKSQVNRRGTIKNCMHLLQADIPQVLIHSTSR